MVVHFAGAHISQFQRWFFGVSLAVTRDIRVEPHPDVAFTVAEAMDRATGGASSCRSTTRRVTRMQRRLPWGPSPLGEKSLGLFTASVCLSDAAPLRVPPPLSESAVASWLCFAPHPPPGFGLQGFSRPGSRAPLGAVTPLSLRSATETAALCRRQCFWLDCSKRLPSSLSRDHFKLRPTSSSTHAVKTATRLGEWLCLSPKYWSRFRLSGPSPREPCFRQRRRKAWTLDFGALLHPDIRTSVTA